MKQLCRKPTCFLGNLNIQLNNENRDSKRKQAMHPSFVNLENLNILTVDQMKLQTEDHGIKCANVS